MAAKKAKNKKNPRMIAVEEQKKRKTLIIGFIITGVVILGLIGYAVIYSVFIKDRIPVAVINGEDVDNEFFKARVRMERNGYIQQYLLLNAQSALFSEDPDQASYYQEQMYQISSILDSYGLFGELVLNNMIDDEIVAIKGREMGVEVSEEEIDAFVGRLFNYYPSGTPTPAPTLLPFVEPEVGPTQEAILGISSTATPAVIVDIESTGGIEDIAPQPTVEPTATLSAPTRTPDAVATPFTDEMFQEIYQGYLGDLEAINVTEKQLRKYLYFYLMKEKVEIAIRAEVPTVEEQVWARHILVASQAEAITILNRLETEPWKEVAAEVSLDTSNKDFGGDLGWFSSGQMVTEFNDAAFELEVGEISQPIETQFGWHIIQLVDRQTLPLEQTALEYKQAIAFNDWFKAAKDSVEFEINEVYKDLAPSDPEISDFITNEPAEEPVEEVVE